MVVAAWTIALETVSRPSAASRSVMLIADEGAGWPEPPTKPEEDDVHFRCHGYRETVDQIKRSTHPAAGVKQAQMLQGQWRESQGLSMPTRYSRSWWR